MKAIVSKKYGSPDVLRLEEVVKPSPKANDVLVRVRAASLNAADLDQMRGIMLVRLGPKHEILGSDMAGTVEAVGGNVRRFAPGDEVFADLTELGFGAFAEYVCVPANELTSKPPGLTFEQAATLPSAAVLALQGLRGKRPVEPGDQVLVNGAGGGMGTFAVQIAKSFGAEVTAVDSAGKLDMLREIGADHVVDYELTDYTRTKQRYDLILDAVVTRSVFAHKRALKPGGSFVAVGGPLTQILQTVTLGPVVSAVGGQKMGLLVWKPNRREDLLYVTGLVEAGKVRPAIDGSYPLGEVPEALRILEAGQVKGKVVIDI